MRQQSQVCSWMTNFSKSRALFLHITQLTARSRENRSKARKGKLRGGGEGTGLRIESDYYSRRQ